MIKFDIDIDDMIKFFKEAGFEIVDAKPNEEGGIKKKKKRVEDAGKALQEAFQIPINIDDYKGENV